MVNFSAYVVHLRFDRNNMLTVTTLSVRSCI